MFLPISKIEKVWDNLKIFIIYHHQTIELVIVVLLLLILGVFNIFIQDDAFISFRYAENFVQGKGLVWNVGDIEPVEGYTNFLWVLLISLGLYFDADPVLWSMILGFIFGTGTLFFTYQVAFKITNLHYVAILSIFLLGTNYTFSSYLTGGLETQLQAFLVITSVYITFCILDQNSNKKLLTWLSYPLLSILFSLTVMTRLDSVLICSILFLAVSYSAFNNSKGVESILYKMILLIVPGLLIVGSWLLFKYLYYGDIFPNTYYVKAIGNISIITGLLYTSEFFVNYGIFPFFILGTFYLSKIQKKFISPLALLIFIAIILIWSLYIIKINGDFMEFRFFVPIMSLLYILISIIIFFIPGWKVRNTLLIFLLFLSFYHSMTFTGIYGIESIRGLNAHIVDERQNWAKVGQILGDMFFESDPPVTISTTAAGAIPYYSKLRTIDMLGLNDKWIAKNGLIIGTRPGHTKYTTIEYLIKSKVDLIIGHPRVRKTSSPRITSLKSFVYYEVDVTILPHSWKVIQIPLDTNFRIDVLYISQNKTIDQAIQQFKLVTNKLN
ncbi:hypothetical protein TI05_00490 [Achromatium sp. WMS3]|nr:hypothetical protein TI05_00490 [Achromatium sp. WMS3]